MAYAELGCNAPPVDAVDGVGGDGSAYEIDILTSPMDATAERDRAEDSPRSMDISMDAIDGGVDTSLSDSDGSFDRDPGGDVLVLPDVSVDPMGVRAPGSECVSDASVREGDPTVAPPRPILPQSVSRVTSQRPSFRWALPAGTTGARVEVCADRCCTRVLQTLEAEGTTARPTMALPPGVAYWRMFGRSGGATGSRASYTWEFEVRRMDAPVDSSWGTIRDFTGDGYDDLLMLSSHTNTDGSRSMFVAEGAVGGPREPRVLAPLPVEPFYEPIVHIGDFNGDGHADLAYYLPGDRIGSVVVMESRSFGATRVLQLHFADLPEVALTAPAVTDWNGDGYSDLVTTAFSYTQVFGRTTVVGSLLLVYRGSPDGLGSIPQEVIPIDPGTFIPWVHSSSAVGDVDLDGHGDVVLAGTRYGLSGERTFLLHGTVDGPPRSVEVADPLGRSTLESPPAFQEPVGDLNGDGRVDIASIPLPTRVVFVYLDSIGSRLPSVALSEPAHPGRSRGFGSVARGGDFNGDGYADLLISAPGSYLDPDADPEVPDNAGLVYVYWGGREGVRGVPILFDRLLPTDPSDHPPAFAHSIASPGDLNGDGVDDLVISDLGRSSYCVVTGTASLASEHLSGCHPAAEFSVEYY